MTPLVRSALSLSLLAASSLPLLAQPAGRPAAAQSSFTVEAAYTGNTPFEANNAAAGAASVTQFGAKFSLPLAPTIADLRPTWSLGYRDYTLERDPFTPLPKRLKSLSTSLSAFRAPVNQWSYFGSVSVGAHEAGSGFSSHGVGVSVIGLANRHFSPDFTGGIGFAYNSLSRRNGRILPIATLDWKPAPGWRAFLGFPRTGASWQASPDLELEFVVEADFGAFYVQDDPAPRVLARPALNRTRLDYQALRVGPAVTWRPSPTLALRAAAGAVPILDIEYRQRGYELESDRVAPFFSLSADWKF